jgi:hypothetical protein
VNCVTADGAAKFPDVTSDSPACGVVNDGLVDKAFAIGVMNNAFRAPQSAPLLHLRFNQAPSGETDAVVAVAIPDASVTIDGQQSSDAEWAGVPFKDVSLRPAAETIPTGLGLNPDNLTSVDHGINIIRVWAAYDAGDFYMRMQWTDDTRNDVPGLWTMTSTGWKRNQGLTMNQVDPSIDHPLLSGVTMDASDDALQIMFNKNDHDFETTNGCGGMCHLVGITPANETNGIYNRGGTMATSRPGEIVDNWEWRAGSLNPIGLADDGSWNCGGATPATSCDSTTQRSPTGDHNEVITYSLPTSGASAACTGLVGQVQSDPDRLGFAGAPQLDNFEYYVGNRWVEAPGSTLACVDHGPSRKPLNASADFIYETGSPNIGTYGDEAALIGGSDTFDVGATLPGYVHRNIDAATATCARCSVKARGFYDTTQNTWTVELMRTLAAPEADVDVDFTLNEL